jgi:16S rRNA (cytidine1402-2'-O)-methyltransferase
MSASAPKSRLLLVPTPLDFGCDGEPQAIEKLLPRQTLHAASQIDHWICENAKTTRACLKRVDAVCPLRTPMQAQQMQVLPREVHKKGDHQGHAPADVKQWLAPALAGHDVGLISEAGMPAIADPGSSVVRAAHHMGIGVVPLTGPVSLMLALAASGLNGQHFAFVGYLPQDATDRVARLRELEAVALKTGQTQLWIETAYRNAAVLDAALGCLKPTTRLAVCCGLTLDNQRVFGALVSDWKQRRPDLPLSLPTVFLLGT